MNKYINNNQGGRCTFSSSASTMMDKPIGANPNSTAQKEYKSSLTSLNELELDAAIGNALGDASIDRKNGTTRLKFEWGNKDYAEHIKVVYDRWIVTPDIRKQERISKVGTSVITWCFQTFSHEAFNLIADLFLDSNSKRTIPAAYDQVINYLTPRAFAYWFMDDGGKYSYNEESANQGYEFHTQGFPLETVNELAKGLKDRYDINCFVKIKNGKGSIVVPSQETGKVTRIIEPFVVDCMKHKLPKSNN